MSVLNTLLAVFSIVDKTMDMLPNYDQRKREKYHDLKKDYLEEINKVYPERDDDRILNIRDKLQLFLEDFSKEIRQKDV